VRWQRRVLGDQQQADELRVDQAARVGELHRPSRRVGAIDRAEHDVVGRAAREQVADGGFLGDVGGRGEEPVAGVERGRRGGQPRRVARRDGDGGAEREARACDSEADAGGSSEHHDV
jgi:hypothetical protein